MPLTSLGAAALRLFRRQSRRVLLALVGSALSTTVLAQAADYPSKPIRLIVGYGAGGASDVPFRALAEAASKVLGQQVIVENRVGAGGALSAQGLFAAKPDGYTIAQFAGPVFRLPHQSKTEWNPVTDFDYVIGINAYAGSGMVVRADSPFKTAQELIAHAKKHPGEVSYGTPGVLTALHLMMEDMSRTAGLKMTHVPFKGDAESMNALLGGHVMFAAATPSWKPFVESGKLRLLMTFDDTRHPRHPDVPTIVELKLATPERTPLGIAVRKGTDPAIVAKLHDAFRQAMESPDFKSSLAKFDMVPSYLNSADYTRLAAFRFEREKKIVAEYGNSTGKP